MADFDYELPDDLIAQVPLPTREASRLLVLNRRSGAIQHSSFTDLGNWLAAGDLLVANNSRVIPARLRGFKRATGGAVEILLLRRGADGWSALGRPAKRLKVGDQLEFPAPDPGVRSAVATVEENLGAGELRLRFHNSDDMRLGAYGEPPLPPYIKRKLADSERYQTVYGSAPGSAAAPTAGLHFTDELINELRQRGLGWAEVTLHVGLDTFRPVSAAGILNHRVHREWCEVPMATAEAIAACRARGGRVVAVGTTSARTLETLGMDWRDENPLGFTGFTETFIVPGHHWKLVDALITNFHLPRSTLLLLVSALAGRESVLRAYAEAASRGYRFYSFGDAMLIR
ncbi:MAG: tRNA preQ1(34) S-adenosylmethionine ribosyltransferase-isomerase QueA [Chloroflexi bacterium]|nr:tRNA preQ1(34) S-adenosylmethionine ribosyltransferase-isomerase QueA [Chloroflexota bacterium]